MSEVLAEWEVAQIVGVGRNDRFRCGNGENLKKRHGAEVASVHLG